MQLVLDPEDNVGDAEGGLACVCKMLTIRDRESQESVNHQRSRLGVLADGITIWLLIGEHNKPEGRD